MLEAFRRNSWSRSELVLLRQRYPQLRAEGLHQQTACQRLAGELPGRTWLGVVAQVRKEKLDYPILAKKAKRQREMQELLRVRQRLSVAACQRNTEERWQRKQGKDVE
jgi:hypothetical protein